MLSIVQKTCIDVKIDSISSALSKKINNRSISLKSLNKLARIANHSVGISKSDAKTLFIKNRRIKESENATKLSEKLKLIKTSASNDAVKKKIQEWIDHCEPHSTYKAEWSTWENSVLSTDDRALRAEAVRKMTMCMDTQSDKLDLSGLALSSLPALPPHINILNISGNKLAELPRLPPKLTVLNATDNKLGKLPDLPSSLEKLGVKSNQLAELPSLPPKLTFLNAADNRLKKLPYLPSSLEKLIVNSNQLAELPSLPPKLTLLNAANNKLKKLPDLPSSLEKLGVNSNQLTELPSLPPKLTLLNAADNRLKNLPKLPLSIEIIEVISNKLAELPSLPPKLTLLNAANNKLKKLPKLPSSLEKLGVNSNQLADLPILPTNLTVLKAANNSLGKLPDLPPSLERLDVNSNQLTKLPEIRANNRLTELFCENNRISSVPETIANMHSAIIKIWGNRLTDEIISQSLDIIPASTRMYVFEEDVPANPVKENWWISEQKGMADIWAEFAKEENGSAFIKFLNKLGNTKDAITNKDFKKLISDWLTRLANDPTLRANTFALAIEATERCEDLVTLTYNQMMGVGLVHDVNNGAIDQRLSEIVSIAREIYRKEQIELIARRFLEKRALVKHIDPIEVLLGFETHLRKDLEMKTTSEGNEIL